MRGSTKLAEKRLPFDTVFIVNRFLGAAALLEVLRGEARLAQLHELALDVLGQLAREAAQRADDRLLPLSDSGAFAAISAASQSAVSSSSSGSTSWFTRPISSARSESTLRPV